MKVTYIEHSCFSVELDNSILLFDYYKGEIPDFDKAYPMHFWNDYSVIERLKSMECSETYRDKIMKKY